MLMYRSGRTDCQPTRSSRHSLILSSPLCLPLPSASSMSLPRRPWMSNADLEPLSSTSGTTRHQSLPLIPSLLSKGMRIEVLFEAHTHLSSSPLPLPKARAHVSGCSSSLPLCIGLSLCLCVLETPSLASCFFHVLHFIVCFFFFFLCFCHPVSFDL